MHNDGTITRCSYDNTQCYKVKTVAKIDSISASQGYTSGGQTVTITGHGFNDPNIDIQIDGVACAVKSYNQDTVTCETGAAASASVTGTNYVGQHGLRRTIYNSSSGFGYSSMTSQESYEQLALHLEAPLNVDTNYGNIFSGYFKAPATTNYRFYAACDDGCRVYLGTTPMDPSSKQLIVDAGYASYRDYFNPTRSFKSEWIPLTAGQYYYIETQHIQYSSGDHVSVAVEIEQTAI